MLILGSKDTLYGWIYKQVQAQDAQGSTTSDIKGKSTKSRLCRRNTANVLASSKYHGFNLVM